MRVATVGRAIREWAEGWGSGWDRFWFTPRDPSVLSMLRIATGVMLVYCHLVLATDLTAFLGDTAWIDNQTARQLHDGTLGIADAGRSYLWHLSDPTLLGFHHAITIVITLAFAAGALTRLTAPLAWFLQLMLIHRLTGALFGLDQIVTYTAMYLMLAPCGSRYSVDAWVRRRWTARIEASPFLTWLFPSPAPSVATNIATRLLQLHLCAIYLFGGLSKARGQMWWDGTAVWFAVANYEYQSMDLTWLSRYPRIFSLLTHLTLFWELTYCGLVWPKATRPLVIGLAIAVHGGIALFLGMVTFGVMMVCANLIFVEPAFLRRVVFGEDEAVSSTVLAAAAAETEDRSGKRKRGVQTRASSASQRA